VGPKALVVEDDEDLNEIYSRNLSKSGFEVSSASTGPEALWLLDEKTFDLVLLDINLGDGMDGVEVCRRIRLSISSDVPIVMLTASDDMKSVLDSFNAGADDYLIKPIKLTEMKGLCTHLLELAIAQRIKKRRARYRELLDHGLRNRDTPEFFGMDK